MEEMETNILISDVSFGAKQTKEKKSSLTVFFCQQKSSEWEENIPSSDRGALLAFCSVLELRLLPLTCTNSAPCVDIRTKHRYCFSKTWLIPNSSGRQSAFCWICRAWITPWSKASRQWMGWPWKAFLLELSLDFCHGTHLDFHTWP